MTNRSRCLAAVAASLFLSTAAPAREALDLSTYAEACDGSAAVALGGGELAVADDDSNVLRVYRIGQARPTWSLPLDDFLEAPPRRKKGFKEADLEAAARIGDRIYWIGSHGRDSKGNAESSRARFFATRIVDGADGHRLETVGSKAYTGLREALLADPKLASLKLDEAYAPGKASGGPPPEAEIGFNIEGLAATEVGHLLIGFRNPRPDGKALLVPLENPAEVVEAAKGPSFGSPILLDLGGRGIRSVDRVGDRYLVVAGPHGPANASSLKPSFALYDWSGLASDRTPAMVKRTPFPKNFSPEALFVSDDASQLFILSDDGDLGGCKDAPSAGKTFRILRVPLPPGKATPDASK